MRGGQTGRPGQLESRKLNSERAKGGYVLPLVWLLLILGNLGVLYGALLDSRLIVPFIGLAGSSIIVIAAIWPKEAVAVVGYLAGWVFGGFWKAPQATTITYRITEDGFTWIPFARYVDAKRAITEGADRYTDRIRKVVDGKVVREMDL